MPKPELVRFTRHYTVSETDCWIWSGSTSRGYEHDAEREPKQERLAGIA